MAPPRTRPPARPATRRPPAGRGRAPETARAARRRRLRRRRQVSALVLAGLVVLALGGTFAVIHRPSSSGGAGVAALAAVSSYSVGRASCTFVDPSRRTHNYATGTTLPTRTLPADVRYPTLSPTPTGAGAHPAVRHGPFPLIVFAAGYALWPSQYEPLIDTWTRAGFVVVSPIFPDTNPTAVAAIGHLDTGEGDDVNQPGDVAFVTRRALAASAKASPACPVLHRLLDASAVGLAGQSDGGQTVASLGYNRAYAVPGVHYLADAVLSGQVAANGRTAAYPGGEPALLVTQSDADHCNVPTNSATLYNAVAQPDKWFLLLHGADHLPPYNGTGGRSFNLVASVTTRFFETELKGHAAAGGMVAASNKTPIVGRLSTGPSAPPLPALAQHVGACYAGAT